MKTFSDSLGQVWNVKLNLRIIRRCSEKIGIDLLSQENVSQLIDSVTDRLTLVFLICEDQAREINVDVDEFEERLFGPGISDKASLAMLEEVESFSLQLDQGALAKTARSVIELIQAGRTHSDQMIKSGEFDRRLDRIKKEMASNLPKPKIDGDTLPNSEPSPGE